MAGYTFAFRGDIKRSARDICVGQKDAEATSRDGSKVSYMILSVRIRNVNDIHAADTLRGED